MTSMLASTPVSILNHKSPRQGIPSDSPFRKRALAANAQGRAFYVVELGVGHRCQFYAIGAATGAPTLRKNGHADYHPLWKSCLKGLMS